MKELYAAAVGFDVPATEVRTLHLGDGRTLATDLGPLPEYLACGLAVAALIAAGALRRATRHTAGTGPSTHGENQ